MPACTRASVTAEKAGIPSVTIALSGFAEQGRLVAKGEGFHGLPIAEYPGRIDMHSGAELKESVRTLMPQVVQALVDQPAEMDRYPQEPQAKEIVCAGTFEEVNDYFYRNQWSDGLPIVPPSVDKIEQFLTYTDRQGDEVIGVLRPELREATVWNVAVNGVMAGCRPEYMPILIAMVEAIADPQFGLEHAGSTPGWEALIILNGPIIRQLRFNYGAGVFRPGNQANMSIGRFFRLYLRNVAGYLPGKTDKATYGQNFIPVLPENEAATARIGWPSLSVDQGFAAGDNVVTITSCRHMSNPFKTFGDKAEKHLDRIADFMLRTQEYYWVAYGPVAPTVIISPVVAKMLSGQGYGKDDIRKYIFDHARIPAWRFDAELGVNWNGATACNFVKEGILPPDYCESDDPDRMLPILQGHQQQDLLIVVSGDPDRNRNRICHQNSRQGFPTSKRIQLPAKWEKLIALKEKHRVNTANRITERSRGHMYISEQLASMITALSLEDVPQQVRETARNSIMDCLGVAVAGAAETASELISAYARGLGGNPDCTIIAGNYKAPPAEAALVNATMAHALDFDDCTDTVGGHPTVVILPAVLALGQKLRSSGRQVLTAYIAGFETEALLAKMVNFEHYDKGWHPTATLGVFGAVGACAKLLELDDSKTAMALSLSVSMACGVKENFGTMTKPLQAGFASRNGLMAAILAGQGFTAKKSAIEGKKGFFEVYNGAGNYRVENLEPAFGNPWDLLHPGVAIKQYPCCGSTHPAVDAVIHLVTEYDLAPDQIEQLRVAVHPRRLAHTNRPQPETSLEAKFSVQYVTAVAAVNRWVSLADFSDAAAKREGVRNMLGRVEAVPLPEDKWGPEHFAAEVDIVCSDGRRLHHRVEKAKGRGPQFALNTEELERKFTDCVTRRLSPETARNCLSLVAEIEKLADIGVMMDTLAGR